MGDLFHAALLYLFVIIMMVLFGKGLGSFDIQGNNYFDLKDEQQVQLLKRFCSIGLTLKELIRRYLLSSRKF